MSLRRLELLVKEVRGSSDTADINSLSPYELMRYFNDGQKQIQKIIFTANPSADIFVKQALYNVRGSSEVSFDLPFNIYAHSSITAIHSMKDNKIAQTLTRVAYREKETLWGYAILDRKFVLTTAPQVSTVSDILLNFVYRLPTMSYRLAKVDSVVGQVVTASDIVSDETFTERYDYYSIVDKYGKIKADATNGGQSNQLLLDSFVGLDFTFEGDLTNVVAGDYIVCGDTGTSHSDLPPECEPYLMTYVQRRILNKIASNEIASENIFTMEERADIEDLFKDTVKDALYPVSADTYYLGY